jgi:hypothetical protein
MWDPEWPGSKRRQFLAGALLSIAGSLRVAELIGSEPDSVAGHLRGIFADPRGATAVGRRYLRSHPEEASAAWLSRTLFGAESVQETGSDGLELLRERVRTGRAQDFRDGDVVILDGWAVTRTEARLLALASICLAG